VMEGSNEGRSRVGCSVETGAERLGLRRTTEGTGCVRGMVCVWHGRWDVEAGGRCRWGGQKTRPTATYREVPPVGLGYGPR